MRASKTTIIIMVSLIALLQKTVSHPTKIPGRENIQCTPPSSPNKPTFLQGRIMTSVFEYPKPVSWHLHVTYMLTNDEQIQRAGKIREKAREHFKDFLGKDCTNRYDNTYLCMIMDHELDVTLGPFPIGEIGRAHV